MLRAGSSPGRRCRRWYRRWVADGYLTRLVGTWMGRGGVSCLAEFYALAHVTALWQSSARQLPAVNMHVATQLAVSSVQHVTEVGGSVEGSALVGATQEIEHRLECEIAVVKQGSPANAPELKLISWNAQHVLTSQQSSSVVYWAFTSALGSPVMTPTTPSAQKIGGDCGDLQAVRGHL